jgi:hypothetical protein
MPRGARLSTPSSATCGNPQPRPPFSKSARRRSRTRASSTLETLAVLPTRSAPVSSGSISGKQNSDAVLVLSSASAAVGVIVGPSSRTSNTASSSTNQGGRWHVRWLGVPRTPLRFWRFGRIHSLLPFTLVPFIRRNVSSSLGPRLEPRPPGCQVLRRDSSASIPPCTHSVLKYADGTLIGPDRSFQSTRP